MTTQGIEPDGDLSSMIQDAVEQAIGQALPTLLDSLTDRMAAQSQSNVGGRVRIDQSINPTYRI